MRPIAPVDRAADVVPQHVPNRFRAVLVREQISPERCRGDFRDVLVLGDGQDFRLVQVTHGDAVLERDHWHLADRRSCTANVELGDDWRVGRCRGADVASIGDELVAERLVVDFNGPEACLQRLA